MLTVAARLLRARAPQVRVMTMEGQYKLSHMDEVRGGVPWGRARAAAANPSRAPSLGGEVRGQQPGLSFAPATSPLPAPPNLQVVDQMLHQDHLFDIALPRLPAR